MRAFFSKKKEKLFDGIKRFGVLCYTHIHCQFHQITEFMIDQSVSENFKLWFIYFFRFIFVFICVYFILNRTFRIFLCLIDDCNLYSQNILQRLLFSTRSILYTSEFCYLFRRTSNNNNMNYIVYLNFNILNNLRFLIKKIDITFGSW